MLRTLAAARAILLATGFSAAIGFSPAKRMTAMAGAPAILISMFCHYRGRPAIAPRKVRAPISSNAACGALRLCGSWPLAAK